MSSRFDPHAIRFFKDSDLPQLEIRYSRYQSCSFAKHAHETASVAIVLHGNGVLWHRGGSQYLSSGDIVLIESGEVHSCNPNPDSTWTYVMFYVSKSWLENLALEMTGRYKPLFSSTVIKDTVIKRQLMTLFRTVKQRSERLEKEATMIEAFSGLFSGNRTEAVLDVPKNPEPKAVSLVKDYLVENLSSNVSTDELSSITGLSRYYLLRIFRRTVGIPPHAYQLQMRVNAAKEHLLGGASIADTALASGFFDQSHFSKKFKQVVGVTPRQYLRAYHVL